MSSESISRGHIGHDSQFLCLLPFGGLCLHSIPMCPFYLEQTFYITCFIDCVDYLNWDWKCPFTTFPLYLEYQHPQN